MTCLQIPVAGAPSAGSARAAPLYVIDFAAQPSQDLKAAGDGLQTIGGRTWRVFNTATLDGLDVTNGTGLVFEQGNTSYTELTGPRIVIQPDQVQGFSAHSMLFVGMEIDVGAWNTAQGDFNGLICGLMGADTGMSDAQQTCGMFWNGANFEAQGFVRFTTAGTVGQSVVSGAAPYPAGKAVFGINVASYVGVIVDQMVSGSAAGAAFPSPKTLGVLEKSRDAVTISGMDADANVVWNPYRMGAGVGSFTFSTARQGDLLVVRKFSIWGM